MSPQYIKLGIGIGKESKVVIFDVPNFLAPDVMEGVMVEVMESPKHPPSEASCSSFASALEPSRPRETCT